MNTFGYTFGYPRISTFEQNLTRQLKLFNTLGIPENRYLPFVDKISGLDFERPGLNKLKMEVEKGDTVYIYDFSRLGRSSKKLKEEIDWFIKKGIKIISHKEDLILTELNEETMKMWCSQIEMDSIILKERLELGRVENDKMGGRPKTTDKKIERVKKLIGEGNTIKDSCNIVGISMKTYYRNK